MNAPSRKPTNLSLDPALLAEARGLKVNLSRAAEDGVRRAVCAAQAERWRAENADALDSSNAFVTARGLPLAGYRQF